ncbi:glycosyltransferase family 2 protein [Natronococcus jeotgali]|uniref:Family 2 glycosyl transferase n=1 Tax=Natronococcus jeotgali DSM 18795 TaxID=1227498 RepID=L9XW65_9EURY|nr:glycosyltransferase family 2 protein [Natronococcus jeotgali]ELY66059.1 family 2 glycosyl transferase [Natronococcus jeotgali DSM 18795]
MYRRRTVGVVVPAYDEAGFVGGVLEAVPDYVDRVYAVDDRSRDRTWAEIAERASRLNRAAATDRGRETVAAGAGFDRRIVPIRHDRNRGVGAAIATGYRRALADGIDVTAVMAGDGQMDPARLPALLDPIVEGDADYAKGNRLADGARDEMPRFRLVGNAALTVLTRIASGYWRTGDPQNGYTAISRRALERLDLEAVYDRYGYPNDLLVRCNAAGLRVADVPMPARYGDEESSIAYATYVPTVSALLLGAFVRRLARRYPLRELHPVPLGYAAGALALAGSALEGARALFGRRPSDGATIGIGRAALLAVAGAASAGAAARLERRLHAPLEVRRDG